MFGRKRRHSESGEQQPGQRPIVTPIPTAASNAYGVFRFSSKSMLDFPSHHPAFEGYHTWYSLKDGGLVTVATPFTKAQEPARFRLADLEFETWVELSDHDGRRIPLAIYADASGVLGRWLPR